METVCRLNILYFEQPIHASSGRRDKHGSVSRPEQVQLCERHVKNGYISRAGTADFAIWTSNENVEPGSALQEVTARQTVERVVAQVSFQNIGWTVLYTFGKVGADQHV
ncbi:hypothetical protein ATO9_17550 [Pseudooceanicola atlanticus]|uniref:Uncharacterized protein n=1 Tax=Pseudooceanicola atlanticus TaxID=1461694 RepID=A0A0A0EBZ0_9RHOB|nr:hypothetical protein ATO9_17550 [Pseudooceanicola atlanticus]